MNKLNLSLITTVLISCGFTGHAFAGEDQIPVAAHNQSVEESFYEDTDGFELSSTATDGGWGWNKSSNSPLGQIFSDSESSSDIEPPPTSVPTTPEHIIYTPYTAVGQTDINWGTANGDGLSVTYKLYQQTNNGGWGLIYNGSSTNRTVSGLTDGVYQYKVKACSTAGCSAYQTHTYMQVRYDDNAVASVVGAKLQSETSKSMVTSGPAVAQLGYAYNAALGLPSSSHCWNVASNADIVGSTVAANTKELVYRVVTTMAELAEELEIDSTTKMSLEYGGYSAESQYNKKLYSKTTSAEYSSAIIAKFKDTRELISAKGEPTLSLQSTTLDQLRNNKTNFRTNCGDQYIDSLTMGRYVYASIQLSSSKKTKDEVRTDTKDFKIDLDFYKGNYTSTTKSTLSQKYGHYELKVYAVSIGSGESLTTLTDINTLLDFLDDLENGTQTTLFPVNYSTKFYNIPSEYNTTDHFSVFTDYRPYLENIQSWVMLDQQVGDRCRNETEVNEKGNLFGDVFQVDGRSLRDNCSNVKRVISNNLQNCSIHQFWASCYSPIDPQCVDSHTGNSQCMVNINKIPNWHYEVVNGHFYVRQSGGHLSKQYNSHSETICLQPGTYLDFSKQWTDDDHSTANIHGFGTTQLASSDDTVDRVSHTWSYTNGQHCVTTYAKVFTNSWFSGGGWYESDQKLHGLVPRYDSYNY